jgi:hypothetical protein
MRAARWLVGSSLLLGAGLAGCEVDPEDPLFVHGRVEHADGGAAEGVPVSVRRSVVRAPERLPEPEKPLEWELLRDEPLAVQPVTRADGTFVGEVLRMDTLLVEDGAVWPRVLQVRAQAEAELPEVRASAVLTDDDVQLPPLRQWRGQVVLTVLGEEGFAVSLSAPPPELGGAGAGREAVSVELVDALGDVAWRQSYGKERDFVSRRVLEVGVAGVRAVQRVRGTWPFRSLLREPSTPPVEFSLERALPTVPLPFEGRTPVSRGATCPDLAPEGPCPLADGRYAPVAIPPSLQGGLTLVLPEPQPVDDFWRFTFRGLKLQGCNAIHIVWQDAESGAWVGGTAKGLAGVDLEDEGFFDGEGFRGDVTRVRAFRFEPVVIESPFLPSVDTSVPPAILYAREISAFR